MPSEDTIILLAVDKEFTHMDTIIKGVEEFLQTKASRDPTDRFNVVFFLENGPVYVEDFTFQWDFLIKLLNDYKDRIAKPNLEGGLFIALTFILDIFKKVSGKYFRILVLKDSSLPPITKDFLVNGLLEKVAPMPVFLDFIDIGMYNDPDEDKILEMINTSKGGELIYATTFQELNDALIKEATNKKEIKQGLWDAEPDYKIDAQYKDFFEDLAADLVPVDEITPEMRCNVCFKPTSPVCGTDLLVRCPTCETIFHDCCLISWAEQSNIGIEHVFRCPVDFTLLKLPEFLVQDILNGRIEEYASFESFLKEIDQDALLKEQDANRKLNLVLKELEF
ncbi:MAG: RING finger protein [Promethearchaeota archaeon]